MREEPVGEEPLSILRTEPEKEPPSWPMSEAERLTILRVVPQPRLTFVQWVQMAVVGTVVGFIQLLFISDFRDWIWDSLARLLR